MIEHHGRKGARSKYREPEQKSANQIIKIKLFCYKNRCNNYTQGTLGYNGMFNDEDKKSYADLRNQNWVCSKHEDKKDSKA